MTDTTPDPDEVYNTLFGPKTPEPLNPERQEVWDALFEEKPPAPLTPEQQEIWDQINGLDASNHDDRGEWDAETTYSNLFD